MFRILKPIFAFLIVNLAVILGIGLIVLLLKVFFGINILAHGNYTTLLLYSFVVGFVGALVSLFLSKWMVQSLYNIQIITPEIYEELKLNTADPINRKIVYLYDRLQQLARQYGVEGVELGIYDSPEPNAFATGCGLCGRLIAFSTGILEVMDIDELDGVLGHEFAHLMNGDMVTTTILQGFLNTFVIFLSRFIAGLVANAQSSDEEQENGGNYLLYGLLSFVLELVFGILVSIILAWYSRIREYAADRDSGLKYSNIDNMINALKKLKLIEKTGQIVPDPNNDAVATLKIYNFAGKLLNLFATHPPLEDRIRKLERIRYGGY